MRILACFARTRFARTRPAGSLIANISSFQDTPN